MSDVRGSDWSRKPLKIKRDAAAGGVVVRHVDGQLEIVLIAVKRGKVKRWALPKGHFKKKESSRETAVREVREETGLEVEIVDSLPTIDYWFVEGGVRYHKFVEYFVMRAVGGRFEDHDDEVTDVKWFPWERALQKMSYENERSMVERSRNVLMAAAG